jgi:hypothetical protein
MSSAPTLNPAVLKAIDRLNYRATIGDVAAQSGLEVAIAEQGVLALATETGATLQVTEAGDVAYVFPSSYRSILQNKYWQIQLEAWWESIAGTVMFLVRFGFGLTLFLMLAIMILVAIGVALSGMSNSDSDSDSSSSHGSFGTSGGGLSMGSPEFWFIDTGSWFGWGDSRSGRLSQRSQPHRKSGSFPEAIFSFVFGDGNPNRTLEERRWQSIGNVIYNAKGAVVAEQVMPYLDTVGSGFDRDYEQFMIPVLSRFNGSPEVTEEGQILYRFPDLQKTLGEVNAQDETQDHLQENLWYFSEADTSLLVWAGLLGMLLLLMSVFFLGVLPRSIAAPAGILRTVTIASTVYSSFYLGLPLVRWLLMSGKNDKISARNRDRLTHARDLRNPTPQLQQKLTQVQRLGLQTRIDHEQMIYTTDRDLLDQEIEQRDRLDQEWQKKLEG